MRRNLHIENSYQVWNIVAMHALICSKAYERYDLDPEVALKRTYISMYIEWWLHNIGYYITKPLCKYKFWMNVNKRCMHVDLEKWFD